MHVPAGATAASASAARNTVYDPHVNKPSFMVQKLPQALLPQQIGSNSATIDVGDNEAVKAQSLGHVRLFRHTEV
jgi:fatty acid/phospholipid biosynthesis enzyme